MKKLFLSLLFGGFASSVLAQSTLDVQSQFTLLRERNASLPVMVEGQNGQKRLLSGDKRELSTHITALVRLDNANSKEQLEQEGAKVVHMRGNIAIVTMPISKVEKIAEMKCVKRVQLQRPVKQKLEKVREAIGVDKIHNGVELPQAYTGKGVVTGIVDSGIEPNHVNFLTPDGKTRFGYMSRVYASSAGKDGYVYENYYPKDNVPEDDGNTYAIEDFKCDSKDNYHGTHTLGIMAGGYKGELKASAKQGFDVKPSSVSNPFYGMATESEIVASCGDLYDTFILWGIEDCVNYAALSNGYTTSKKGDIIPLDPKPCVINLSLGSNLGSHDPNSLMNSYISEIVNQTDAIICVAAGNEADTKLSLNKKFTEDDMNDLKTFIAPLYRGLYPTSEADYYNLRNGEIYIYGYDESEFEIQVVVYNKKRGSIAMRMACAENTNGTALSWASDESFLSGATVNPTFAKAFHGYVGMGSLIDEETGRYYGMIQYTVYDNQETNADGNYMLGLIVKPKKAGQRVNVISDVYYSEFSSEGIDGWLEGTNDGSISDMACAKNTIAVGAYNTRDHWTSLDGYAYGYTDGEYPVGDITFFSSFGESSDGRVLPHICAPGACVISSVNRYFVDSYMSGSPAAFQAQYTNAAGENDYWFQTMGTSMATPAVAGTMALWLEADPTLKPADALEIIQQTATRDKFVENGNPRQWGAGKLNAYEGLKEVLRRKDPTGIKSATANSSQTPIMHYIGGKQFEVSLPGVAQMNVELYSSSGVRVKSIQSSGDEVMVDASSLTPGVYMLKANNVVQKVTIR